ncbi:MAG: CPBP family glutamic-type intramembrane protease [Acidimicrobiaceae bacterium]|nr:CPBP family glutamic-type intramembrane protease [Acidimicrobiaceae bacterium]
MTTDAPSVARKHWWSPQPPPDTPPTSTRRAYLEVLLVFAAFFGAGILAAGFSLGGTLPRTNGGWGLFGPNAFDQVAQAGLAVALVVLLLRNRGMSRQAFGLDVPRQPDGSWALGQILRVATWAVVALIAGSLVTSALATGKYDLPSHLGAPFLFYAAASSLNAGVIEEVVVLGFVVATLRQARRPMWEVLVVAVVLRASYHVYYGPGVVGILIWGSVFVWLYLRTRSLLPIMAVHFAWDTTVFMSQRWPVAILFGLLIVFVMVIAAPITWLVERSNQRLATAPGLALAGAPAWPGYYAPPGWRPDPWGQYQWRWWDGVRWTDTTA